MRFEDISIGQEYYITYKDPNYPCRCRCHSNENVMHCMPCCYDMSYYGMALCIGFVSWPHPIVYFKVNNKVLSIWPQNVWNKQELEKVLEVRIKGDMTEWFKDDCLLNKVFPKELVTDSKDLLRLDGDIEC